MKKRKAHGLAYGRGESVERLSYGRVRGRRPKPRDGHTGIVEGNHLFIFGGDRHRMPFNDLYSLDVASELEKK